MSGSGLPWVEARGNHYAIGAALGESLRKDVQGNIENYYASLPKRGSRDACREQARSYLPRLKEAFPDCLDEVRGIADGAATSFGDVLVWNLEQEFLEQQCQRSRCFSLAVRTPEGIVVGHNEDWDADQRLYVARVRPEGAPSFLTLGYAGQLPCSSAALNEYGIAFTGNSLSAGFNPDGIPLLFLMRLAAEAAGVEEAVDRITSYKRMIAANLLLASPRGMADLELTPEGYALLPEQDSFLMHTNHFLFPPLQGPETDNGAEDSAFRLARGRELLRGCGERGVEAIRRILSDHEGFPYSICKHAREETGKGSQTRASALILPEERRLLAAGGNPCSSAYRAYSLL